MTNKTRDEFSAAVKNKLAARVGYHCSRCNAPTSGPGDDGQTLNTGIAAHISAAAPGGPRYDINQTPDQRKAIDNGIWLCISCSKIVDNNIIEFSVEKLIEFKSIAEETARAAQQDRLYSSEDLASSKLKGMRLLNIQLNPTSPNNTSFELSIGNIAEDPIVWLSLLLVFCKEDQNSVEARISRTSYQLLNDVSPIDKGRSETFSFDANGLGLSDLHQTTIVIWCKYAHSTSRFPVYFDEVSKFEIVNGRVKRTIQPNPSREKFLDLVRKEKSSDIEAIENSNPTVSR
jgi:hypothetical protein